MSRQKIVKLELPEEGFNGTTLFAGISTLAPIHKLSIRVNSLLGTDLRISAPLEIRDKKSSKKLVFSRFTARKEEGTKVVSLVSMKAESGNMLTPSLRGIDYLLIIKGATAADEKEIRALPAGRDDITAAIIIEGHRLERGIAELLLAGTE